MRPGPSRSMLLLPALLVALPQLALAQGLALQGRSEGAPAGMAVPSSGAAAAEEPIALEVNPAGTGFVDGFALQYFHEGGERAGQAGDGFWLATPLGHLVPTFAMQWVRPGDGAGARFRKTSFGLAAGDGRTLTIGVTGNWFSSPDPDLDRLWTFDAGVTVRPWRHLSIGASVLGVNSSAPRTVPVVFDVGVATRLWRDRLTVSADLLADDRGRNDPSIASGAVGLGVEVAGGVAVQGQLQFPVRSGATGPAGATYGQVALTWNTAHVGITAARASGGGAGEPWLIGARLSSRRYLATRPEDAPQIDLARSLARPRLSLLASPRDAYGALLRRLQRIRDDASAAALVVTIDDLPVGQGRVEELRRLLLEIRSRKPVIAYLVGGGMKEYYLASAATKVVMQPSSTLSIAGVASSTLFFRDTLAHLGIAFDVVAIGRYKTAPDPLVRSDMSEAQREVTESLLDDIFGRQVRGIAESRGVGEERIRAAIDSATLTAAEAIAARLVDAVAWPDEVDALTSAAVGHHVHTSQDGEPASPRGAQRWGPRPAVAVIRVEGAIAPGESRQTPFGSLGISGATTVSSLIERAARDRDVVAIVVRIESPGGDGTASDLIWRAVMQARRKGKPVIASMGDLAASGGYLVATAADFVLAEPSTLTGSIGVFAVKPDLSGLLDKIGTRAVTLKRGRHADLQSVTRRWTPEERALLEREVRSFYDLFVARVAAGRGMTPQEVERLAGGRVWTGAQAAERRLVDRLGSFDDAVRVACERTGTALDDVEVRRYEPPRTLLGRLASTLSAATEEPAPWSWLARAPGLDAAAALLEMGPLLALPPDWLAPAAGAPPAPSPP